MRTQREAEDYGRRYLQGLLRRAARFPELRRRGPGERWGVELAVVGAEPMRRLNRRYRKRDYATDVLSFEAARPVREGTGVLGELVVCLPVARRQAREQGHAVEQELRVLLVHGLLHLLGFDHERGPRHAAAQARWERKLLGGAAGLSRA